MPRCALTATLVMDLDGDLANEVEAFANGLVENFLATSGLASTHRSRLVYPDHNLGGWDNLFARAKYVSRLHYDIEEITTGQSSEVGVVVRVAVKNKNLFVPRMRYFSGFFTPLTRTMARDALHATN